MNKFDSLINSLLKEEVSREDRLNALKDLAKNKSFRVITIIPGELGFVERDEIVERNNIEELAEEERLKAIETVKHDLQDDKEIIGDEDEGDVYDEEEYTAMIVKAPVCSGDNTLALLEVDDWFVLIISDNSRYFFYTKEEIFNSHDTIFREIQ